mgnify:FL=1|jgi:hypothetical protein|tara:strand:+ start:1222 stop:1638 length:417 start_codon:yes stop_codon:yes gene_type:complete
MSVLKATSWGRTRGPKTLVGVQGAEVDVVVVASLDAVTDGYSTENQRYLHVMLVDKNVSTALTVTLYGYNHAFGKWAPLNTVGTSTALEITVADSGTAEGSQTAANRELMTFEIVGVDRVAFVGTTADVRCYAACSTF